MHSSFLSKNFLSDTLILTSFSDTREKRADRGTYVYLVTDKPAQKQFRFDWKVESDHEFLIRVM